MELDPIRAYLTGRIKLPPSVAAKPSRFFMYGGSVTIPNGSSGTVQIQIQDDAHFLVEGIQILSGLQSSSQDLATVKITDATLGQDWSNSAVSLRDIAGTGQSPKWLKDPNLLRPTSTLSIAITNNTGSDTTFDVCLPGRKLFGISPAEEMLMNRRMWYIYVLTVTTLGASVQGIIYNVQVYNQSDFLLKKLNSQSLISAVLGATGGTYSQDITMNLRDTSTDISIFNTPLNARLIFGQGQGEVLSSGSWSNGGAFALPKPMLVKRNSILEGTFNNRSTTAQSGITLALEGARVFDPV